MATEIPKLLAMQTVNGLPTISMEQDYRQVPNSSYTANQYRWFTPETSKNLLQQAVDQIKGYYAPMVARVNGSIPGGSSDPSQLARFQQQAWYGLLSKDTSQMSADQLLDEIARAGYYSGDVNAAKQWLTTGQSAGAGMVTLSPEEMKMLQLGPTASNYWEKSAYEKRLAEIQGLNSGALVKVPIAGTDSFYTVPSNDPSKLASTMQMASALSAQAAKGTAAITAGTPTGPQSTPLPPNFQVPTNQPVPADALTSAPSRAELLARAAASMPTTNLSRGMEGPEVKKLQDMLVQFGFMTAADMATGPGIFGPKTQDALARFQAELAKNNTALAGASKDFGNYGALTRAAMTPENLAKISQNVQTAALTGTDGNSAIANGTQSMTGSGVPTPKFEGDFSNVSPGDIGTMFQVYLSNMLSRQKKLQEAQDALNAELTAQKQNQVGIEGRAGQTSVMAGRQLQKLKEQYAYKTAPLQSQVESITAQMGIDANMFNSLLAYGKYVQDLNKPQTMTVGEGQEVYQLENGVWKKIATNEKDTSSNSYGGILAKLPSSIQGRIISIAESFGNSDIVKRYNNMTENINAVNAIKPDSKNVADHQAMIYAFAKGLDPDSAVKEGEYDTIKKYAQSLINRYGKQIENAIAGNGFLSAQAITNIQTTMNSIYDERSKAYKNLYVEKSRVIDNIAGTTVAKDVLVDYSLGFTSPAQNEDSARAANDALLARGDTTQNMSVYTPPAPPAPTSPSFWQSTLKLFGLGS